jgi:hypothetical protein
MPFKTQEVLGCLKRKFEFQDAKEHSDDHIWVELLLEDLPVICTKFSRGSRELSKKLEAHVARQLRVTKKFFNGMISCSHDRDAYYNQVRAAPVPPWDVHF